MNNNQKYNAQTSKLRIKELAKQRNMSMDYILKECNLGVNAIRQINDTKGMASFSLAKIADCLNCSVDYLLGRTDIPEVNKRVVHKPYYEEDTNSSAYIAADDGSITEGIHIPIDIAKKLNEQN